MFNDYATKKLIKNAFRVSKVRGETAIRLRVPGGHLRAKYLPVIQRLAEKFGNGTIHLTTRQGYEIPGVKLEAINQVKKFMAKMLAGIEKESNLVLEKPVEGYPASGTRNISACIGNRVCSFANADTTALAQETEKVIYPNDYHLKVAVTGCPNDCIKAHMNDIGIIATIIPEYNEEQCIGCEACVEVCRARVTNALRIENYRIIRDDEYCIRCGECILKCPTGALYRGRQLYRIIIGGRTGKRNPRLANTFIQDASREVVLALFRNIYEYIDKYVDRSLPKEHAGYIFDRTGEKEFKREILRGVKLNPEAKILRIRNPGYVYPRATRAN